MARILSKYTRSKNLTENIEFGSVQDYYTAIVNGLKIKAQGDLSRPYNFKEWFEKQTALIPGEEYKQYNIYLQEWYTSRKQSNPQTINTKDTYVAFIKELEIIISDKADSRFYDLNINNLPELVDAIPYYAKKLKDIAQYLIYKREAIKKAKLKYNISGATQAIERLFYEYLLKAFTKNKHENEYTIIPELSSLEKIPDLSAVTGSFQIFIEELYDDTSYFDRDPSISTTTYFPYTTGTSQYLKEFDILTIDEFEWLYSTGVSQLCADNPLLWAVDSVIAQYDNGVFPLSAIEDASSRILNEYNKISLTQKYLGEEQYIISGGYYKADTKNIDLNISTGDNWFYWPSGSTSFFITEASYTDPISIHDSNIINSGATPASAYRESDIIFTQRGNNINGAWLQSPYVKTTNTSMSALLVPGSNVFSFPYPGFGLSGEDIFWTGKTLDNLDFTINYLDDKTKQAVYNAYWSEALNENITINTLSIHQLSLIEINAHPNINPLSADNLIIYSGLNALSPTYNNTKDISWLYKLTASNIPITVGDNNIYWPYEKYTDTPILNNILLDKDICNDVYLSSIDVGLFSGAIAGDDITSSDVIYKLDAPGGSTIEAAWLSAQPISSYTGDTSGSSQIGLSLKINPGVPTMFLWTDDATNINNVFKHYEHIDDCPFNITNNPNDCECKAIYYSPYGHDGSGYTQNEYFADIIIKDTQYPNEFDIETWRGSDNLPYDQSNDFAWYKTTDGIGWLSGSWQSGSGNTFTLQQNTRYKYIRTTQRKNNTVFYIINYTYNTTRNRWMKAVLVNNKWVKTNNQSNMLIKANDYIRYVHRDSHQTKNTSQSLYLSSKNENYDAINFLINIPLYGWNYITNTYDGVSLGARPIWSTGTSDRNYQTRFKGINASGGIPYVEDDYVIITQPKVSRAQLSINTPIEYVRRTRNNITWVQPLTLNESISSEGRWKKILIDQNALSPNISDIINDTDTISITATNDDSDIIFNTTIGDEPLLINYYSNNNFTWSQEVSNTTAGIPPTGGVWVPIFSDTLITPNNPEAHLSNRHFPTYASIPYMGNLYSDKQVGGFFVPSMLGVSTALSKYPTIVLSTQENLINNRSANIYRNINNYASDDGLTLVRQQSPVEITDTTAEWMKRRPTTFGKAGVLKDTVYYQDMAPYQAAYESLRFNDSGLFRHNDKRETWQKYTVYKQSTKIEWPLITREYIDEITKYNKLMAMFYTTQNNTLVPRRYLYKWKTDVFGNQYALYKKINYPEPLVLDNTFNIRINITSSNEEFKINFSNPNNMIIDWGDNVIETDISGTLQKSHIYTNTGIYIIRIAGGTCSSIRFNDTSSRNSVLAALNAIPDFSISSFDDIFSNCANLSSLPTGLFSKNHQATSFNRSFLNCINIQSLPLNLFGSNSNVTYMIDTFKQCTSLSTIPNDLFINLTNIVGFSNTFSYCANLSVIPNELFTNNINAISFNNTFAGCTNLQYIPSDLFSNNELTTDFVGVFAGCETLTTIPNNLFTNNQLATNFAGSFLNCTNLTSVPNGLFDNNPNVVNFSYTFRDCTNLASIPVGLFDNNQSVVDFRGTFYDCSSLDQDARDTTNARPRIWERAGLPGYPTTINGTQFATDSHPTFRNCVPIDWGGNGTQCDAFNMLFNLSTLDNTVSIELVNPQSATIDWGDGNIDTIGSQSGTIIATHIYAQPDQYIVSLDADALTQIGIIQGNSNLIEVQSQVPPWGITSFTATFFNCNNLSSIPVGLFDNNAAITSFIGTFLNCNNLSSIPVGLFDNNVAATGFASTFFNCNNLSSIPVGLFDNNVATTSFTDTFRGCTNISSIPAGLFDNNVATAGFVGTFYNCNNLSSIPVGLFDNNIATISFASTFYGCTNISSIPVGLFDNNVATASFYETFYNCNNLSSIPVSLFDNNTATTNFASTFRGCTNISSIPVGLFDNNTATTNFASTFALCINISSIPVGLFDNNTEVTSFEATFKNTGLLTIQGDLFFNNDKVTNFSQVFRGCRNIPSIPVGLFDNNVAVTNFSDAFSDCTNLTSIPVGLFDNNQSVVNFGSTFLYCNSLDQDARDTTSTRPRIWERAGLPGYPASINGFAFANNTHPTFKNCVPIDWGGNGINCDAFNMLFNLSTLDNTVSIELANPQSATIDWGDGNIDTIGSQSGTITATHIYAQPDQYFVSLDADALTRIGIIQGNSNLIEVQSQVPPWGITSFAGTFDNCNNLSSIPVGLFDNNTAATSFGRTFQGCTNISSIPVGLFDNNVATTSFAQTFFNCNNLSSIPVGLFDNNTATTSFYQTFRECTNISSIPVGLFDNNTANTSFASTFDNCNNLSSIPAGLFDNNTANTSFAYTFFNCNNLSSIPVGLFDNNVAATSFDGTFFNCNNLSSIPVGLFDNNTATTSFVATFAGCTNISSIPVGLFFNNDKVTNFVQVFRSCYNLTSIPVGLFDNNVTVTNFSRSFEDCTNIPSIPVGLFDNNVAVTNFSYAFARCAITSIPVGLFDNNPNVTTFANTFFGCTDLSSIPVGLFDNNPNVADFNRTFFNCRNISFIPNSLFDNNINTTSFFDTLRGTGITSIPSNLFDYNVNVTSFYGVFKSCGDLTSIPTGLFDNNTNVTTFENAFSECRNITSIPVGLFDNNTNVTSFINTFYDCISLDQDARDTTSTQPRIWERAGLPGYPATINGTYFALSAHPTFRNCVPVDWDGNGTQCEAPYTP